MGLDLNFCNSYVTVLTIPPKRKQISVPLLELIGTLLSNLPNNMFSCCNSIPLTRHLSIINSCGFSSAYFPLVSNSSQYLYICNIEHCRDKGSVKEKSSSTNGGGGGGKARAFKKKKNFFKKFFFFLGSGPFPPPPLSGPLKKNFFLRLP